MVVLPLGYAGRGGLLAVTIVLATLSDIFDGIVARRFGIATTDLRRIDSVVDLAFWLATLVALFLMRPAAVVDNSAVVAFAVGAEVVQQGISLIRFRRMTATHARTAEFMGLCLLVGMTMLALGGSSAIAFWIIGIGTLVATLDGWAIVILLPYWEADIPSALDALRLRKGIPIKRHWLG